SLVKVSLCCETCSILTGVPSLSGVSCGDLASPSNGEKLGTLSGYGATAIFSCNTGYTLMGSQVRECLASGLWSGTEAHCIGMAPPSTTYPNPPTQLPPTGHCGPPDPVVNGQMLEKNYSYQDSVVYQCNQGFRIIGQSVLTCEQNHTWSGRAPTSVSCGHPGNPTHGLTQGSHFDLNDIVRFVCNIGYALEGALQAQCQPSGQWSSTLPTCSSKCVFLFVRGVSKEAVRNTKRSELEERSSLVGVYSDGQALPPVTSCSDPGHVEHGTRQVLSSGSLTFGFQSSVSYSCDPGYELLGLSMLTCQGDGSWDQVLPTCLPEVQCVLPRLPPYIQVSGERRSLGAVIRFSCLGLRSLVGNSTQMCQLDGGTQGVCGDPGVPLHGLRVGAGLAIGSTLRFSCEPGHILEGSALRRCQADGTWTGTQPHCRAVSCGNPGTPRNGRVLFHDGLAFSHSVSYSCREGYYSAGPLTRHCAASGTWTGSIPLCSVISCGDPGVPANGVRLGDDFTYNRSVTFGCSPGYALDNDRAASLTCTEDRTWNGSRPVCRAIVCRAPPSIPNGHVLGTDFRWGSTVSYSCSEGHRLSWPAVLTCQGTGEWSGQTPHCLPMSCGDPGVPAQGRREERGFTYLSSVTFSCPVPLVLANLTWSGTQPWCTGVLCVHGHSYLLLMCVIPSVAPNPPISPDTAHRCHQPELPPHANVRALEIPALGYTLLYTCQPGFLLAGGSELRTCRSDGSWTGKRPTCTRELFVFVVRKACSSASVCVSQVTGSPLSPVCGFPANNRLSDKNHELMEEELPSFTLPGRRVSAGLSASLSLCLFVSFSLCLGAGLSHHVPGPDVLFTSSSQWKGSYEYLGKKHPAMLVITAFQSPSSSIRATLTDRSGVEIIVAGSYRPEDSHLLLEMLHIQGPVEMFLSKFKRDGWALDGHVSYITSSQAFIYQGFVRAKGFGRFGLQRIDAVSQRKEGNSSPHNFSHSSSIVAAVLLPVMALSIAGVALYLYKHRKRPRAPYPGCTTHENSNSRTTFENPVYDQPRQRPAEPQVAISTASGMDSGPLRPSPGHLAVNSEQTVSSSGSQFKTSHSFPARLMFSLSLLFLSCPQDPSDWLPSLRKMAVIPHIFTQSPSTAVVWRSRLPAGGCAAVRISPTVSRHLMRSREKEHSLLEGGPQYLTAENVSRVVLEGPGPVALSEVRERLASMSSLVFFRLLTAPLSVQWISV
ncbi:hypothetical protein Z043_124745, partial [Scleropages formosus]